MELPKTYIEVQVREKRNNKIIGNGYFVKGISRLFLFHPSYPIEYTKNEIIELFELHNPDDGIRFDQEKLFTLKRED